MYEIQADRRTLIGRRLTCDGWRQTATIVIVTTVVVDSSQVFSSSTLVRVISPPLGTALLIVAVGGEDSGVTWPLAPNRHVLLVGERGRDRGWEGGGSLLTDRRHTGTRLSILDDGSFLWSWFDNLTRARLHLSRSLVLLVSPLLHSLRFALHRDGGLFKISGIWRTLSQS